MTITIKMIHCGEEKKVAIGDLTAGIYVWLHQIMYLFIFWVNGIVLRSFACSDLFPQTANNFPLAEPAS